VYLETLAALTSRPEIDLLIYDAVSEEDGNRTMASESTIGGEAIPGYPSP
jgi:hypothetical protein